MSIILENQIVKAGVVMSGGRLHINFTEDPSFALCETVLIDLMQRSIGVIYQSAYHHIGELPNNVGGADIVKMTDVRLTGQGGGGRKIELHAPIKILSKAV